VSGRHDYELLSDKTSQGTVNQVYYDKQLTNGVMTVWPQPSSMKEYIRMTIRYPVQDVTEVNNDLEMAQEWYEALAWLLAERLFPKYEKPIPPDVALKAAEFLEEALAADAENTSSYMQIAQGNQHNRGRGGYRRGGYG
jgi:hypothetical protein